MRISVAPSSIAASKSWLIPIDRNGNSSPSCGRMCCRSETEWKLVAAIGVKTPSYFNLPGKSAYRPCSYYNQRGRLVRLTGSIAISELKCLANRADSLSCLRQATKDAPHRGACRVGPATYATGRLPRASRSNSLELRGGRGQRGNLTRIEGGPRHGTQSVKEDAKKHSQHNHHSDCWLAGQMQFLLQVD